jgi:hypothetical protein
MWELLLENPQPIMIELGFPVHGFSNSIPLILIKHTQENGLVGELHIFVTVYGLKIRGRIM